MKSWAWFIKSHNWNLVQSFSTEGLVPHDLAFETAGDEHVVARTKLGADDQVLVDAEALAHLHHAAGAAEVSLVYAVGQFRTLVVQRQQPHTSPERRAHDAPVRGVT